MITHSKPYTDTLEIDAVNIALKEGRLGAGIKTKELEELIGISTGFPPAIATPSASYSIYLILKTLFPNGKAKVALQSYVCRSVYDSIIMADCIPMLFDINNSTFGINTTEVLKHPIDVVIITHLFGVRSDYSDLINKGICIIEDCAQRITPNYVIETPKPNWRVYSFEATKIITCGQGGAITGKDEDELNTIRHKTSGSYTFSEPCLLNSFSDVQACIAMEQWKKINSLLSDRKKIALYYIDALRKHNLESIIHESMLNEDTWHFRFILQVKSPDTLIKKMEEYGVVCRKPVNPFGLHTLFNIKGDFTQTELATRQLLSIPLYPALMEEQANHVIQSLIKCYG